jgi:hypothetical protein
VFQFFPYVASASMRLDNAMAKVDGYRQRAMSISTALATLPQLTVLPAPSQTKHIPRLPARRFAEADRAS